MEYSGAGSKKSNSEGEHVAGPGNDDGKGPRAARCRELRRGDEATIVLRATISVLQGLSLSNERGGAQMLRCKHKNTNTLKKLLFTLTTNYTQKNT